MKGFKISVTEKNKHNLILFTFSLLSSFLILMICTRSSFLYPFNDWSDANCFFTVGKAVADGQIIYKDIFEQKGPLLYFIHTIAYFISHDTFTGVFIIEILSGTLFMFFNIKTSLLYINKGFALFSAVVCSAFIYSSMAFCQGDSAEELCLPAFSFTLYLSAKAFKEKKYFSEKQLFAIGVVSGCLLWIKYTMLGFFIGWIIVPVLWLIKDKKYKKILYTLIYVDMGVTIVTIPIILYFLINNAVTDLFTVYFYNNMFLYSSAKENVSILQSLYNNMYVSMLDNKTFSIAIFIGFIGFLFIKGKKQKVSIYLSFAFLVLTIFGTSRYFGYYCIVLSSFSIFGYIVIFTFIQKIIKKFISYEHLKSNTVYKICYTLFMFVISVVISITICFNNSDNVDFMNVEKSQLPQYKFREIICKEKNPTLLQYGGLDGGFYTVCDIMPNCKYFCGLNVKLDEITEGQNNYVKNGNGKFIVTRDYELISDNYELISTEFFNYENDYKTYRLYKLKSK